MSEIVTMIQTVGFPIVMCLILLFHTGKKLEKVCEKLDRVVRAVNGGLRRNRGPGRRGR